MNKNSNRQTRKHKTGHLIVTVSLLLGLPHMAQAEVIVDGTVGNAGRTDVPGPNYDINASYGEIVQNNLFHSFETFNINVTETATFSGPANIANIVGRVTGGSASTIDGTVTSSIAGANLWLINPSGLVFGQNASVNVSGSFHASTGDSVLFDDPQANFSVLDSANTTLTVGNPVGFGFVGTPAGISLNTTDITVGAGQTISLAGGDVVIADSTLNAQDGRINIAAVAEAGQVLFTTPTDNQSTGIDTGSIQTFANINIENSTVSTSLPAGAGGSGDGGGSVYILGGNIYAGPGTLIENNNTNTTAGVIHIQGQDIMLDRALVKTEALGLGNTPPKGADIVIKGDNLTVQNVSNIAEVANAGVVTVADNAAVGGDIHIEVNDTVHVTSSDAAGFDSVSGAVRTGFGSNANAATAGDINIQANRLLVDKGGQIFSDVTNDTANTNGSIRIAAGESVTVTGDNSGIGVEAFGVANTNGVEFTISTSELTISDAGRISSDSYSGSAGVGIDIDADNVVITGANSAIAARTGNNLSSDNETAVGGGITLVVRDTLTVTDNGRITSDIFHSGQGSDININQPNAQGEQVIGNNVVVSNGGFVSASTKRDGAAGTINVDARLIDVSGRGESFAEIAENTANGSLRNGFFSVSGDTGNIGQNDAYTGRGGDINLNAGTVRFDNGGVASASAINSGDAGNINIDVSDSLRMTDSAIQTEAQGSAGGVVDIQAVNRVELVRSQISAEAFGVSSGNDGGNIVIADPSIVTLNSSQLVARANAGNGGNVTIRSNTFLQSADSIIDVSSKLGIDGQKDIESLNQDVTVLPVITQAFLDVSALLGNPCAIEALQGHSSLVVETDKPPLPYSDQLLSSEYLAQNAEQRLPLESFNLQLACR